MKEEEGYYVYVIYSEKADKFYVGQTRNLEQRINKHNFGRGRYTSNKGDWSLKYFEEAESRGEAMKKEKFFKTGRGREYWKSKLVVE